MEEATLSKFREEGSLYGLAASSSAAETDQNSNKNQNPRVIILASTYGEGEPTDNATCIVNECNEALQDNASSSSLLKDVEYSVFGLGNREYDLFNAMGKYFDTTFEQLGAQRIHPLGLGDDNDDIESDFEKWKDALWATLKQRYLSDDSEALLRLARNIETSNNIENNHDLPDCEYSIQWHSSSHDANDKQNQNNIQATNFSLDHVHGSSKHYFTAIDCPVSTVRELLSTTTQDSSRSTVHVELDITNLHSQLSYETADNLGVLPCNNETVVESVAKSLGYDLNAVFSLRKNVPRNIKDNHNNHQAENNHECSSSGGGDPFPMPLTVRECLKRYLDLTSAPRRSDLKLLSLYATDPIDRKALQRWSSKDGKTEYKEKIVDSYRGMVDILHQCPSLQIPLEHLISICRFTLPRFYTISSCPLVFPDSIHLTVAVTQAQRKDGTLFEGVCSSYIAKSQQPNRHKVVRVFTRPSAFRLPNDTSKPIIMIGPGTGIAPMRALLQQRRHQQLVQKKTVGRNVLYFGCHRKEQDYLYQDEMQRYLDEGILTELHVAFSRQDPHQKIYVQHLLQEQASSTWNLIDRDGAYLYVCGGVHMGHDVAETLKDIICTHGQLSLDQAHSYLSQLSRQGRYVQELWS